MSPLRNAKQPEVKETVEVKPKISPSDHHPKDHCGVYRGLSWDVCVPVQHGQARPQMR